MNAGLYNTAERKQSRFPRVVAETASIGRVTIPDHRPSTLYQRQLRETMAGRSWQGVAFDEKSSSFIDNPKVFQLKKTNRQNVVQREVENDPFISEENPNGIHPVDDRFLIYGLAAFRGETLDRLQGHEGFSNRNKTINDLNEQIGLTSKILTIYNSLFSDDLFWIHKIRRVLNAPNPIERWRDEIWGPNVGKSIECWEREVLGSPLAISWLRYLIKHKRWIGLEDLGADARFPTFFNSKIRSRGRFKKNIKTPEYIAIMHSDKMKSWLENPEGLEDVASENKREFIRNFFDIEDEYDNPEYSEERDYLNEKIDADELITQYQLWLTNAFLRRTSKLGIRFARDANLKVLFNTASLEEDLQKEVIIKKNGIKELSNWGPQRVKNGAKKFYNRLNNKRREKDTFSSDFRPITVSEYREYQRLWWKRKAPDVRTFAEWKPGENGYTFGFMGGTINVRPLR
ncbi:MAG: hypothetical protein AAGA66_12780 [Bacteroidota bacterium]